MPLVRNEAFVRIPLTTTGEWVDVKPRLSVGDVDTVKRAITKGVRVKQGEPYEYDADNLISASTFTVVEQAVKDWSFRETDGIAVTPDALRMLSEDDFNIIVSRLNELYPAPRTEDERGN